MHRMANAIVALALFAAVLLSPQGAAPPSAVAAPAPTLTQSVSALLGHETAAITTTRVGSGGVSDPSLANALNTSNAPGRQREGGVYDYSKLELTLHTQLQERPGFQRLASLLNPDDDIQPRANGSFAIDFARLTQTEVEFLPGKRRRTYFYEMALTFTLLDAKGRTVYSRETHHFRLHVCIIEREGPCQDIVTGKRISPDTTWRQVLLATFDQALANTLGGLSDWVQLLQHIQARLKLRRHGATLAVQRDAAYVRNKELADYPYLFLTVPPMRTQRLADALRQRGADLGPDEHRQLVRYLTASLRGSLDQALRSSLQRSPSMKQAGVFILPDPDAIWFQDALARVTTDAVNAGEAEITITSRGEREELPPHLQYFGRLCAKAGAKRRQDRCLALQVIAGDSSTVTGDQAVTGVLYAQQIATASGLLVDLSIDKRRDPHQARYYPHSIAPPKKRIHTVAHESDQYLRVSQATGKHNDDRVYLRAAALAAARELGMQMVDQVTRTFREEMLR